MKKILVIGILLLLVGVSCKKKDKEPEEQAASFEILDENGTKLTSGMEISFNTTDQSASFGILIRNTSNEEILLQTELVEVNGTDGSQFEVCIGSCYPSMQLNTAYPLGSPYRLAAGATTADGEVHYWNHFNGPCYYVVEIYQVDGTGNKIGEAFRFKYIHN